MTNIEMIREKYEHPDKSIMYLLRKANSSGEVNALEAIEYISRLEHALAALSTMTDEQKLAEKYRLIALMNFETALANRELELGGWVSDHAYSIQLLDCQIAELDTDKEEPTP